MLLQLPFLLFKFCQPLVHELTDEVLLPRSLFLLVVGIFLILISVRCDERLNRIVSTFDGSLLESIGHGARLVSAALHRELREHVRLLPPEACGAVVLREEVILTKPLSERSLLQDELVVAGRVLLAVVASYQFLGQALVVILLLCLSLHQNPVQSGLFLAQMVDQFGILYIYFHYFCCLGPHVLKVRQWLLFDPWHRLRSRSCVDWEKTNLC